MTPFIQLLHNDNDRTGDWCTGSPERKFYTLDNWHKAIFLVRQMFALQYVKFCSYQYNQVLDQYQEWILQKCNEIESSPTSGMPDVPTVLATIRSMRTLTTAAVAELSEQQLSGFLDADVDAIPCQMPQTLWQPFLLYCKMAVASETPKFNPNQYTLGTREGCPGLIELGYRRICITPYQRLTDYTLDPVGRLGDLQLNNVFGYLSCFNWSSVPAECVFGMLSNYCMPSFYKSIMHYIHDCVLFNGRTCDPVLNIQDYDIGGGQSKALLTFLLNLRTRYNVEFQSMETVNRLLLVDRTGGISKSLAKQFQLELEQTTTTNSSVETLAAYPYSFLHTLFMAKKDEADPDPEEEEEDPDTKPKTKSKVKKDDTSKETDSEDDGEDVTDTVDAGSTDTASKELASPVEIASDETDTSADDEVMHEDNVDKIGNDDAPPDEDATEDTSTTDEDTPDPATDDSATQPDPEAASGDTTMDETGDTTVSSDESTPNESDPPVGSDTTPVDDPATSEVGDSSSATIGALTIKLAEAPSLQTALLKDQIKLYIDQILANPPPVFTQQELTILRSLRLYWLYLYSVDTVTTILDKVLTGKSLPKLVIQ
jgi:hypothetical protein